MFNQPKFVPGLKLAEGFFYEAVKPILDSHYSRLSYSAALIRSGSEVLGFDAELSMDHHWGPRVMLFLSSDDFVSKREIIRTFLSRELPAVYRGFSTKFSEPDPSDKGVQILQQIASRPVNHRIEIYTFGSFFTNDMNIDVKENLEPVDWLTLPSQKLRSVTLEKSLKMTWDWKK